MSRFLSTSHFLPAAALLTFTAASHAERPRTHDGWFLRAAGGVSMAFDPAAVTAPGVRVEGTPSGTGAAFDLLVGGSPMPGLILGGGGFLTYVPNPRADNMKATVGGFLNLDGDVKFDGATVALLAPFVDYYPDAHGGLHFTAAIGVALLSMGDGTLVNSTYQPFRNHGAVGAGASGGVGYEWWVGDRWSVGVLGRLAYAAPSGDDNDQTEWQHHLWLPALLITATMN